MNSGGMGRNSSHTAKKHSDDQITVTGFFRPWLSASTSHWFFPEWTLGGVTTALGDQGILGKLEEGRGQIPIPSKGCDFFPSPTTSACLPVPVLEVSLGTKSIRSCLVP